MKIDALVEMLTKAAQQFGRKDFRCAADVWEALKAAAPASKTRPRGVDPMQTTYDLLAVDIFVIPDFKPGQWTLQHHTLTTCEVNGDEVSHANCPTVEGTLDGASN